MERDWWKKGLAEMLGGFGLVTVGAGSVLAASLTGQNVILFAAFGHALVIAVLGTVLGPISGGQISPAVSLGLIVTRRQKVDIGIVIIAFQLIGSIIGGFFLLWLYPVSPNSVGAVNHLATPALKSVPTFSIDPLQGVVIEGLMTFLLVFVVFATAIDSRGTAKTLGAFPIGFAVGIDWLFGGALTGAAMSPGRWLGPAVASGYFDNGWVYWVGPLLGGVLAALVYENVFLPRKERV